MTNASRPTAPAPARCAGLRHALLHDWSQGFPVDPSPFQAVARRVGGSLREVLGHCHALQDEGALETIRVHWSESLQRVRWRCSLPPDLRFDEGVAASLATLPGVVGWDIAEDAAAAGRAGHPPVCFDIVARHAGAARAQVAWFETRHGLLERCEAAPAPVAASPCDCAQRGGPCSDPDLAGRCESGMPVVAHPYRALSTALERRERDVIATLRHWQRSGRVRAVGLDLPDTAAETLLVAAVVEGPALDAAQREALQARPGIVDVEPLPGRGATAERTRILAGGHPDHAAGAIGRALRACGLGGRGRELLRLRRVRLRAEPRLFADPPFAP